MNLGSNLFDKLDIIYRKAVYKKLVVLCVRLFISLSILLLVCILLWADRDIEVVSNWYSG